MIWIGKQYQHQISNTVLDTTREPLNLATPLNDMWALEQLLQKRHSGVLSQTPHARVYWLHYHCYNRLPVLTGRDAKTLSVCLVREHT